MRIERFLLCLAWGVAVGAWAAPCSKTPRVLVQAEAGGLGLAGRSQRILTFSLSKPGRVWAEAEGLTGLEGEDREQAPEVFLDDSYLGPLLPDFGSSWRSPRALWLAAGPHTFLVRCSEPGGEGPSLGWKRLRVLGDPRCPPLVREVPSRKRVQQVDLDYAAVPLPCGAASVRGDWPARLGGRALVVSGSGYHAVDNAPLVRLAQGQVWRARMKIPLGSDGQALPLMARFDREAPGRVRFWVGLDHGTRGRVSALGYHPGVWEPLTLSLCSGQLALAFAQAPVQRFPCPEQRVSFDVSTRDLSVSFAPYR